MQKIKLYHKNRSKTGSSISEEVVYGPAKQKLEDSLKKLYHMEKNSSKQTIFVIRGLKVNL